MKRVYITLLALTLALAMTTTMAISVAAAPAPAVVAGAVGEAAINPCTATDYVPPHLQNVVTVTVEVYTRP